MSEDYPRYWIQPCTRIGKCEHAREPWDICVICEKQIDDTDDHWHLLYYSEEDSVERVGDLCRKCQRLSIDDAFKVIREEQRINTYAFKSENEEYRQLIVQSEILEQHLEWLNRQIENKRHQLDNRRVWSERYTARLDYGHTWYRTTREDLKRQEREKQEAERIRQDAERQQQAAVRKQLTNGNGKRDGFVYLILSEDGHYKIGRTRDVPTRTNTLEIQLPYQIEVIHSVPVKDMYWAEKHLHDRFAPKRVNGEWFKLETDDVEWIKSLTELEQAQ